MTAKVHRLVPRATAFPREPESHVRLAVLQPPSVRGDCVDGPRPCPWAGCRHHILLSSESCALDVVAKRGPLGLEEIAELLGVTRERVRQIEERGLRRLKKRLGPEVAAMLAEWTHSAEVSPEPSLSKVVDADFKAAVHRAYERIVPEREQGAQALRVKGPKP